MSATKPKEVKRLCPECEQEVALKIDQETGDREGRCENCGLDVGAVVNRLRYAKATKKVEDEEETANKGAKKGSSWF
jgi:DNA-directed RNA polymerase subunit RPC12/RpoP